MKRWVFSFLVFPIIAVSSISLVFYVRGRLSDFESFEFPVVASVRVEPIDVPVLVTEINAEFDPKIEYSKKLKVKLLEVSDFDSSEVPYKSGELWIGLYKDADSYTLRQTKIIVKSSGDTLHDKTVSTELEGETLFLLRGAHQLSSGPVTTIFNDSNNGFDSYFVEDPVKSYFYNGSEYKLRLENSDNGYLRKGSQLVLERDGTRQLLRSLNDGCDDCGWSVEWVGDLDRDGKLDFYLDLNNHYNASDPALFLSSSAKEGKLVGILAGFHVVGC